MTPRFYYFFCVSRCRLRSARDRWARRTPRHGRAARAASGSLPRIRSCQTCVVRIYLGSDHAGFELKASLVQWLAQAGHEPVDCGPASYSPDDDYPVYVMRAASSTVADPGSLGIVIGGSGNGEQMASNKVPGVRAALVWNVETARLARQHNDANVLSLGAREYSIEDATMFAKVFVETPFSQEPRHVRRLAMIEAYERTGQLPVEPAGP